MDLGVSRSSRDGGTIILSMAYKLFLAALLAPLLVLSSPCRHQKIALTSSYVHSLPHTCEVAGFKSDVIFLKADFSGAVAGKIINVSFVPLFPPISNGAKPNSCFPTRSCGRMIGRCWTLQATVLPSSSTLALTTSLAHGDGGCGLIIKCMKLAPITAQRRGRLVRSC